MRNENFADETQSNELTIGPEKVVDKLIDDPSFEEEKTSLKRSAQS